MDRRNQKTLLVLLILALVLNVNGALIVSTDDATGKEGGIVSTTTIPEIYQMHITSNIRNRFSHTTVTSRVRNSATKAQEAVFSLVLPEAAYISGFIMEVDGKNYTAYVKEKEEAKRVYEQAVASGFGAGHVAVSARDSNRFMVSVNIQPESKATFYLNYEQLLDRKDGRYEQVININPGQPVKDLNVEVVIAESRKITDLKAPPLRSGNEVGTDKPELDPRADIAIYNDTAATVTFKPNVERQKELAHIFGTKEENGLSGQFVVQYDVERDPSGGEVLIQDGYFVHFFAPSDLEPLPKYVVFVLDTSGSMWGQKIEQLRQAMHSIIDQLHENDLMSLVEFNSNTKVWDLNNQEQSVWYPHPNRYYYQNEKTDVVTLENAPFPRAYPINSDIVRKAKEAVSNLKADGSTSMYGGLQVALRLVELERNRQQDTNDTKRQPIIIFLTDGDPTDLRADEITTKITEFNSEMRRAPIFTLSFGDGADKKFLQKLASRNSGFSKHIYEAADASLQLQGVYRLISSPLLSDIKFEYESTSTSVTKTQFPIHFRGSEIVVAGIYGPRLPIPRVNCIGTRGPISLKPVVTTTPSNIERIWAYLTIKQLLEKKEASPGEEDKLKKQALDLALKYSFVTPVSSLVVVKPNDTRAVDTEEANLVPRPLPASGFSGNRISAASIPGGFSSNRHHMAASIPGGFSSNRHHIHMASSFIPAPPGIRGGGISYHRPMMSVPRRVATTTRTKTMLEVLLQSYPWLDHILTNGLVKGPTASYKLGLNETISDNVPCPKSTNNNEEGHCTLLHNCQHAVLPTVNDYYDHFCVLRNEFAGVCCPK